MRLVAGAKWHREMPMGALPLTEQGARRIEGGIDLLRETSSGYVIVDRKSFPGRQEHWPVRALEYAPQFRTYAESVTMVGGMVSAMLIHFTVGGGIVDVGMGSEALFRSRVSRTSATWVRRPSAIFREVPLSTRSLSPSTSAAAPSPESPQLRNARLPGCLPSRDPDRAQGSHRRSRHRQRARRSWTQEYGGPVCKERRPIAADGS
jgi:hypothetical protein